MWSQEEEHRALAIDGLASLIPWAYDTDQPEEFSALLKTLETVVNGSKFNWALAMNHFLHASEWYSNMKEPAASDGYYWLADTCMTYVADEAQDEDV